MTVQLSIIRIDGYGLWTTTLGTDRESQLQMLQARIYYDIQRLFSQKDCIAYSNRFDEYFVVTNCLSVHDHIPIDLELAKSYPNLNMSIAIGNGDTPYKANLDAYEAYLRGKECFNRPTYDQQLIQQSIRSYQKAVELDPEFALAYAGLARSHLYLFHEGYDATPGRLAFAKTAVDKALELKPDLPAANVALGYYYYHGLRDYKKALEAFSTALKEAPSDTDTLAAIGFVERRQGKFEESVQHLKSAIQLDPRVADLPNEIGEILTRMRRYAEAEK